MESEPTDTDRTNRERTNWNVDYDVDPIRLRDPAAEALAVLEPGDPFVITYEDIVTAAGHSCPTTAGAYRISKAGLEALYPDPDSLPVRGDVEVLAGGPRDDPAYGVTARLVSYVTGAAGEDGFGGLAGGHGDRRNTLEYGAIGTDGISFEFTRTDVASDGADGDPETNGPPETARVTYHVESIPEGGPAIGDLPKLIDDTASPEERDAFAADWHGRVREVLEGERYVSVDRL
ncbi:hypothetical protein CHINAEXTREME_11150 [Halobiforma lacisalsi AJ5]|uniref:Formylmethanofuran dehydrogenase subunit E domain-containing protein n=1 Tax=Natronobacterium lacisalsi AJ5 TaxID=358396 RepID=M0L305_NATLA|nr:hypothetical protein [Halobiforma lacisalsi]APW98315.1 hypothetical protein CHINAEXTREME_11150 [Halobiforma lacisalsi AJ5]EMA27916.1 hypothetical protein C445_19727 [Halobiforma lacisalsi AJ5]